MMHPSHKAAFGYRAYVISYIPKLHRERITNDEKNHVSGNSRTMNTQTQNMLISEAGMNEAWTTSHALCRDGPTICHPMIMYMWNIISFEGWLVYLTSLRYWQMTWRDKSQSAGAQLSTARTSLSPNIGPPPHFSALMVDARDPRPAAEPSWG